MNTKQSQREQLRQLKLEKERKQRNRFIAVIIGIAIFFLAIIFLPPLLKPKSTSASTGFSIGDPNALVKVEEFSDFRCSACTSFNNTQEDAFIKEYIDTGKVYLSFFNLTFMSPDSIDAAEGAACAADQNAFWEYKDILFTSNTSATAFTQDNLIKYANELDLDINKFEACLSSDVHLADIEDNTSYANSIGVQGTPSFYINGTVVYSDKLIEAVEAALAASN